MTLGVALDTLFAKTAMIDAGIVPEFLQCLVLDIGNLLAREDDRVAQLQRALTSAVLATPPKFRALRIEA